MSTKWLDIMTNLQEEMTCASIHSGGEAKDASAQRTHLSIYCLMELVRKILMIADIFPSILLSAISTVSSFNPQPF